MTMMAGKPSCFLQCYSPCTCPASCAACLDVEQMSWGFQQDCCVCHLVKASFARCLMLPGVSMDSMARNPYVTASNCPTALLEACLVPQQGVATALCR